MTIIRDGTEATAERGVWLQRLFEAYQAGFDAGRATACVALAEM